MTLTMTSRDRIRTTLDHREPDRVPIDLGSSPVTGIAASAYRELMRVLGIEKPLHIAVGLQLAWVDEEVQRALGCDVRRVGARPSKWREWTFSDGTHGLVDADAPLEAHPDGSQTLALDGGGKLYMPANGWFFDPVAECAPMRGVESAKEVEAFYATLPAHAPAETSDAIVAQAEALAAEDAHATFGDFPSAVFECWQNRGFETYLMDFLENPDLAHALMRCHAHYYLEYWRPTLERMGHLLDIIWVSDDLGSQHSTIVSEETYVELVKPLHRELWSEMKRLAPNAKLFLHSCGAIAPLIPHLIELGVDILNPIQVSARGMDPVALKRDFGRDLVFWGGGVDTQNVLQQGTPEEVRDEVHRRIDQMAPGGGYVFATVHDIQPGTPPENIRAAFEAALEWGGY